MAEWSLPGYTELARLGQGGFGRVVLARRADTGEVVAIKYLFAGGDRAAFRHEAAILRRVVSPFVARLYAFVETPAGAAIVMEAVPGVSLRAVLDRSGVLAPESALALLKGSLLGLAAAHAAGTVHRDYKPGNVLVQPNNQSKLVDFGIALLAGHSGQAGGTPAYMAPEQWLGHPATPATDVYAATCVFFQCVTGGRPYEATTTEELRALHATAPPPLARVPEPLRPLIARGMAKSTADRPAGAAPFVAELEAAARAGYGHNWELEGWQHLVGLAGVLLAASPMAWVISATGVLGPATALLTTGATALASGTTAAGTAASGTASAGAGTAAGTLAAGAGTAGGGAAAGGAASGAAAGLATGGAGAAAGGAVGAGGLASGLAGTAASGAAAGGVGTAAGAAAAGGAVGAAGGSAAAGGAVGAAGMASGLAGGSVGTAASGAVGTASGAAAGSLGTAAGAGGAGAGGAAGGIAGSAAGGGAAGGAGGAAGAVAGGAGGAAGAVAGGAGGAAGVAAGSGAAAGGAVAGGVAAGGAAVGSGAAAGGVAAGGAIAGGGAATVAAGTGGVAAAVAAKIAAVVVAVAVVVGATVIVVGVNSGGSPPAEQQALRVNSQTVRTTYDDVILNVSAQVVQVSGHPDSAVQQRINNGLRAPVNDEISRLRDNIAGTRELTPGHPQQNAPFNLDTTAKVLLRNDDFLSVHYDHAVVSDLITNSDWSTANSTTVNLRTGETLAPDAILTENADLTQVARALDRDGGVCGMPGVLSITRDDFGDAVQVGFTRRAMEFTLELPRLSGFANACGIKTIAVPYGELDGLDRNLVAKLTAG